MIRGKGLFTKSTFWANRRQSGSYAEVLRNMYGSAERNLRLFADENFRICVKTSRNFTAYAVIKFQLFWA